MSKETIVAIDPTTNRIVPDAIPRLAQELGIKLVRGIWLSTLDCDARSHPLYGTHPKGTCVACLVGTMAAMWAGLRDAGGIAVTNAATEEGKLPRPYVFGLSDGWEGGRMYRRNFDYDDDILRTYNSGVDDGKAAYKACVAAGLMPKLAP